MSTPTICSKLCAFSVWARVLKAKITDVVTTATERVVATLPDVELPTVHVERARDRRHGDFATNVALVLAKPARRNPRELAQSIIEALPDTPLIDNVEIAGPGFINFRLSNDAYREELELILDRAEDYGRAEANSRKPVLVEFVSANPTGPLHVGHGRLAAYGATVANLLGAVGHRVHREYYVNDAGRQMNILAVSTYLRYLEQLGEPIVFPVNGYRGAYVADIARSLADKHGESLRRPWEELSADLPVDEPDGDKEAHIDALIAAVRSSLGEDAFRTVLDTALAANLADIRADLAEFGVVFDEWFSERRLFDDKLIDHALDVLRESDQVYEHGGALWFRASDFGDEKDRVVVRDNGQTTYIASDIAYHLNKCERGYDILLDVLGADHHGYVARMRAGLEAMGRQPDCLKVRLVQFAMLYRGGEKVQMSTRSGEFVTLRELREEVGTDAARFFYVMRSNDQHLDFDLELAKSRSNDNPVYYIQYAHARVCRIFDRLAERDLKWDRKHGNKTFELLTEPHERELLFVLTRYPEVLHLAASNHAHQHLVHYLQELATAFHAYYNAVRILDDKKTRDARLNVTAAVRQVIRNGLGLLGVSAPQAM